MSDDVGVGWGGLLLVDVVGEFLVDGLEGLVDFLEEVGVCWVEDGDGWVGDVLYLGWGESVGEYFDGEVVVDGGWCWVAGVVGGGECEGGEFEADVDCGVVCFGEG